MTPWVRFSSNQRRRIFFRRRYRSWLAPAAAAVLFLAGFGYYHFWLPDVSYLRTENPTTTAYMRIYVRRSRARGKKPIVMMRWRPLAQISPYLRHAVLIEEDVSFYRHAGVDWSAVKEALEYDIKRGKWSRGGSTITQQVARNLFLSPARSKLRKSEEILIARKLERALTKPRILEIYLNIAEWGVGVYGAQAASEIYFGKSAGDLTLDEAVALATALPSPWRLNPLRPPGPLMVKKREIIVDRMRHAGYLPPDIQETEIEVPQGLGVPEESNP